VPSGKTRVGVDARTAATPRRAASGRVASRSWSRREAILSILPSSCEVPTESSVATGDRDSVSPRISTLWNAGRSDDDDDVVAVAAPDDDGGGGGDEPLHR
jgi:hypothetical protein